MEELQRNIKPIIQKKMTVSAGSFRQLRRRASVWLGGAFFYRKEKRWPEAESTHKKQGDMSKSIGNACFFPPGALQY
ncbi:hypothetical protein [Clostridium minihomine]|uniref:hypothetical protein n=1 Tax=Clostridium minihomine TaxID=2045012 RepID=UPI000C77158F|nr:hypothetical protein [Clostridium minihomine]